MVSTITFSQMSSGGALSNGNQIPGLLAGENVLFTYTPQQLSLASYTPVTCVINTDYIVTDASQVTFTLPVMAPVGSIIAIIGTGSGGWVLQPGIGQTIQLEASTAHTSITSAERYDCISVECTVANTTWVTRSYTSTGFTIS